MFARGNTFLNPTSFGKGLGTFSAKLSPVVEQVETILIDIDIATYEPGPMSTFKVGSPGKENLAKLLLPPKWASPLGKRSSPMNPKISVLLPGKALKLTGTKPLSGQSQMGLAE